MIFKYEVKSDTSSNLLKIEFDDNENILSVEFLNLKKRKISIYDYYNVPKSIYDELVKVDSKALVNHKDYSLGKTFDQIVKKSKYKFVLRKEKIIKI